MNEKLKQMCFDRNVEYLEKGNGHVQLKGALLVNYYPNSKNKSAYVAGTKRALKSVSLEQAVAMCFKAPVAVIRPVKRSSNSRPKRAKMLKKGITKCHWCKAPLTLDTSTIEHIIPLSRGGLDHSNNRTLACEPCNQSRGGDMPELKTSKGKP